MYVDQDDISVSQRDSRLMKLGLILWQVLILKLHINGFLKSSELELLFYINLHNYVFFVRMCVKIQRLLSHLSPIHLPIHHHQQYKVCCSFDNGQLHLLNLYDPRMSGCAYHLVSNSCHIPLLLSHQIQTKAGLQYDSILELLFLNFCQFLFYIGLSLIHI